MSRMLEVLVVDDEAAARELLHVLLGEDDRVQRVRTASSAVEALKLLKEAPVDLLLLDVEMPGGDGFDLLEALPEGRAAAVVFTTSHAHYALRAIRQRPHGYLLKPIDPEELRQVVGSVFGAEAEPSGKAEVLELRTLSETHFVHPRDVLHLHGDGAYTHVHLLDGRELMVSMNLGRLEALLPSSDFFRCHRSHIVALAQVRTLHHQDGGLLELVNGDRVPLATRKQAEFEARMRH